MPVTDDCSQIAYRWPVLSMASVGELPLVVELGTLVYMRLPFVGPSRMPYSKSTPCIPMIVDSPKVGVFGAKTTGRTANKRTSIRTNPVVARGKRTRREDFSSLLRLLKSRTCHSCTTIDNGSTMPAHSFKTTMHCQAFLRGHVSVGRDWSDAVGRSGVDSRVWRQKYQSCQS